MNQLTTLDSLWGNVVRSGTLFMKNLDMGKTLCEFQNSFRIELNYLRILREWFVLSLLERMPMYY